MAIRLDIAQRGALIVGIPSLLQLLFGFVLLVQVGKAQKLGSEAFAAEYRVCLAAQLQYSCLAAAANAILYQSLGADMHKQEFDRIRQVSLNAVNQLDAIQHTDSTRKTAGELTVLNGEFFSLFQQLVNQEPGGAAVFFGSQNNLTMARTVRPVSDRILSKLNQIVSQEKEIVETLSARLVRTQQQVLALLICNCLLVFFVAGLICIMLYRAFAVRLAVMVDNTFRIARGQDLAAAVAGTDEIAELDAAMHLMNRRLKSAQSFRQEMINMISHDLRSPLTSVHLFFANLQADCYGELTQTASRKVGATMRGIESLLQMVDDLLDAEKVRAGKLEIKALPIELTTVIEECVVTLQDIAAERKIAIELQLEPQCRVLADAGRIAQVLNVFLANAIKFSPQGGKITLAVRAADESWRVIVSDQGPWVSAETQERMFAGAHHIEAGMGLSFAKSIVDAHGGKLGVESTAGCGASFWFSLRSAVEEAVDRTVQTHTD